MRTNFDNQRIMLLNVRTNGKVNIICFDIECPFYRFQKNASLVLLRLSIVIIFFFQLTLSVLKYFRVSDCVMNKSVKITMRVMCD